MLAHLQDLHRHHQRSYQRLPQHHYQNHLSCSCVTSYFYNYYIYIITYTLLHITYTNYILHILITYYIYLLHIHWLLTFQWRIFEKTRRLKKPRILSGLIHFSRLKLAFFKKVAFLPTLLSRRYSGDRGVRGEVSAECSIGPDYVAGSRIPDQSQEIFPVCWRTDLYI